MPAIALSDLNGTEQVSLIVVMSDDDHIYHQVIIEGTSSSAMHKAAELAGLDDLEADQSPEYYYACIRDEQSDPWECGHINLIIIDVQELIALYVLFDTSNDVIQLPGRATE